MFACVKNLVHLKYNLPTLPSHHIIFYQSAYQIIEVGGKYICMNGAANITPCMQKPLFREIMQISNSILCS